MASFLTMVTDGSAVLPFQPQALPEESGYILPSHSPWRQTPVLLSASKPHSSTIRKFVNINSLPIQ